MKRFLYAIKPMLWVVCLIVYMAGMNYLDVKFGVVVMFSALAGILLAVFLGGVILWTFERYKFYSKLQGREIMLNSKEITIIIVAFAISAFLLAFTWAHRDWVKSDAEIYRGIRLSQ